MAKSACDMGCPNTFNTALVNFVEEMLDEWLSTEPKYQNRYCPGEGAGVGEVPEVLLNHIAKLRPVDLEELTRRYEKAGWVVGGDRTFTPACDKFRTILFAGSFVLSHPEHEPTLGEPTLGSHGFDQPSFLTQYLVQKDDVCNK